MNTKDLLLGGMVLGGGNSGGSVIIPNISATAESIDAGQDASVQQTGTDTNIVFNFQIPRGFDGPMGAQGPRGLTGAQGPVGATGPAGQSGQEGPAGPQGIQGPQGPAGAPFLIYKVYPTVDEMNAGFETDGIQEGQLVGISQETGGEQGGYLYIKGEKEYQFFFDINKIDGIQGPQGEQGPQGPQGEQGPAGKDGQTGPAGPQGTAATIRIGTVSALPAGTPPTVVNMGNENDAVFDFAIPQGEKGDTGERGLQGGTRSTRRKRGKGRTGGSVANKVRRAFPAILAPLALTAKMAQLLRRV